MSYQTTLTLHGAALVVSMINTGFQGPQGEVGPQGTQGEVGLTGPAGPAGSDAAVTIENITDALGAAPVVEGDARLSNARPASDVYAWAKAATKPTYTYTEVGAAAATHTHTTSDVTGLGTAAVKNVPATGNASATQVVLGSDTRLTDARTPTSHTTGSHSDWPAAVSMTEVGYLDGVTSAIQTQLDGKQATLVSGTNIKTINGKSPLGAGNIEIQGGVGVALSGDTAPYVTQTKTYTITNYNSFSEYVVQASAGSVSLSGDTITFIAPAAPGTVTLTVIFDGVAQLFAVTVQPSAAATPVIASPIQGATGITETPTIATSAFAAIGASDTHLNTDWEIRTAANGAGTLVASNAASATDKTSWTVSAGLLSVSTTYYVRARHRGTTLGASAWGESSFTTAATFNSYIPTPAATPASFGDAFEGGFYGGLYWDQIAQSSSSKTLATGTQTFTVPDMTGAPIVYAGQTIEVRSRANPANKFIGTVTGAAGTTLTLNVTSIGGSGTLSDWSVMSRFRAIFAPKSSGEHAGIALKNANTAFPTGCQSLVDGWTATEAMKNADTSTVYPAAHWARSLNIGGRTDWHIPARHVLELAWRNLKPVTNNNYATADRPTAQTFDYKRDGAYGDTANTHGTNNNSAPAGSACTASVPAQTAATAFRTGGSEAFEFGSAYYWSSTEYSAAYAWGQNWGSSDPGYQNFFNKASAFRVRAVRRSII